ncbi:conserved hypothetical protein [Pirellula staleyi DSM 6068]|uniref:Protein SirB1 N-terminal domain-containing protein n=1 Tax=Pirellula staleyi (strain ATCC 27377 / DSM 6068 / ICPB 4128) TaxID=530564 RepID=D2R8H9_PIRSD|nr:transglutaminase-like domain-containing protein [Pirellula staleyi]ADB17520.1 conserved hypothetical protein [Pirellula staleyi DSM 6068]
MMGNSQLQAIPRHTHPLAYRIFTEQLGSLHETQALLRAAIAISIHALEDVQIENIEKQLSDIASRVRSRARSGNRTALLAHLHEALFIEEGLAGHSHAHHLAINNYLPVAISSKRGLPVVMSLIYLVVGQQVGLEIQGLAPPGHFFVRVLTDEGWVIIDPFFRGELLTRDEAYSRLDQIHGRQLDRDDRYLAPIDHAQWIERILANLTFLFAASDWKEDHAAMLELSEVLRKSRA